MKHAQKVKLDNYKEHLKVVKENLDILNKEVEAKLLIRDDLDIEPLKKEIQEKSIYLESIKVEIEKEVYKLANLKKELESKNNILANWEKNEIDVKEKLVNIYSDKLNYLSTTINKLKLEEESKKLKIVELDEKIKDADIEIGYLHEEVDELIKEKSELEATLNSLKESHLEEENRYIKKISELKSELATFENLVNTEKANLVLPNKALDEREKVLDRRELDLEIVTKRLRNLYREIKPGIQLKI